MTPQNPSCATNREYESRIKMSEKARTRHQEIVPLDRRHLNISSTITDSANNPITSQAYHNSVVLYDDNLNIHTTYDIPVIQRHDRSDTSEVKQVTNLHYPASTQQITQQTQQNSACITNGNSTNSRDIVVPARTSHKNMDQQHAP